MPLFRAQLAQSESARDAATNERVAALERAKAQLEEEKVRRLVCDEKGNGKELGKWRHDAKVKRGILVVCS